MIPVTKPFLPDKEKYKAYVDRIYENNWLTNKGPLFHELEARLKEYLGVKHLVLVANGTLALQLAYKALDLKGEVITTPFSFPASTSTLVWEGLTPIFADIDHKDFNIHPNEIEKKITSRTTAIVPVHVFGNPCKVEEIQQIADKYALKVIYDGAHTFGVKYKQQNILNYGDISTISFHATKLFHTIEGGAVITNDDQIAEKIRKLMNFGFTGYYKIDGIGINAKMNEFEAAMGHCVLDDIDYILNHRKNIWKRYESGLHGKVTFQEIHPHANQNYSYAPILFDSEAELINAQEALTNNNIFPRRYFYPSLDTLNYLPTTQTCKVSRGVAKRILCLPIYPDLTEAEVDLIVSLIVGIDQ